MDVAEPLECQYGDACVDVRAGGAGWDFRKKQMEEAATRTHRCT
jgi:hypothetical protein